MSEPVHMWFPAHVAGTPPGPFTVDRLRESITKQAGKRRPQPSPDSELVALADLLNALHGAEQATEAVKAAQAAAAEVRYAFRILARFFDTRRQACEKSGVDQQTAKNNRRLCDQFDALVEMMAATPLTLETDAGVYPTPELDRARLIAQAFRLVIEKANPTAPPLGYSNAGPIARLTMEALQTITGKSLRVYNVGQHLKQPHEKKLRRDR